VGGFDEILFAKGSGEDWDIDKKIKKIGKIGYLKCTNTTPPAQHQWLLESFVEKRGVRFYKEYAGIYHNESDFKLMPYLRKKLYYSKGFEGYINKWGRSDEDVRRQFSFLYRYITVFIEKNKWKRLFSRIDLLIGMYFLRIAVGFIFIYGKYMK
jgi:hypothetical protein